MKDFVYLPVIGELILHILLLHVHIPHVTYSSQVRSFVTYSVCMEFLIAYSVHIPICVDIFYKSNLFRPNLYASDFYGLLCLFTFPW